MITGTNSVNNVISSFVAKGVHHVFSGAGIEVAVWVPTLVAFGISFFTSMGGVSGAFLLLPFQVSVLGYTFHGESFDVSFWGIFTLSWIVGIVGGIYGIGGGAIIAPFYPEMAVAPDWLLGVLFGLGGMAGMYLGARCLKFIPAAAIKWMLAAVIIATTLKYGAAFLGW